MDTKKCSRCKEVRSVDQFWKSIHATDGLQSRCVTCMKADARDWRSKNQHKRREQYKRWFAANPDSRKRYDVFHRFKKYGITEQQFNEMLRRQNYCCAICGTDNPLGSNGTWAIDHDHSCCPASCRSCGKCIRGILCQLCNQGLGCLRESLSNLRMATAYLENPPARQVLQPSPTSAPHETQSSSQTGEDPHWLM